MFLLKRSKENCANNSTTSSKNVEHSLYKICIRKTEELLYYACRNIERNYGSYNEERCRQEVEELQKLIFAALPPIVFDDLREIRQIRINDEYRDIRIDLAFYMHSNMKKFTVNNFIQRRGITLDCTFLAMHSSKLQNLAVLDLNLSCTDEILKIVAENCHKLMQIGIVSQVRAMCIKEWSVTHFNALKLRYCISDVGLGYLCKCKLLKKITMNRKFRSNFGGGLLTLGGIRKLVKSLPLLEDITFEDMGLVLADEMEDVQHLSLTCLSDSHPQPAHFDIFSRLCPNLKQLCVRFPCNITIPSQAQVLRALASCDLKVCELQVLNFSFSTELAHVIQTIGCYLNSLALENIGFISSQTIVLIRSSCPNLINLHLSEESFTGEIFSWFNKENFDTCPAKGDFGNLQYLTLTGKTWRPNDILPLCLTSAKGLKMLKLHSLNDEGCFDTAIAGIIPSNSLQNLETVSLLVRSTLTIETLEYFFKNCPRLMELSFLKTAHLAQEEVDMLCAKMLKQNFTMCNR